MPKTLEFIQGNPLIFGLGLLVAAMLVHFVAQYVIRGLRLRAQLAELVTQVATAEAQAAENIRAELTRTFSGTRLARIWREFEESLHEQRVSPDGTRGVTLVRATQPAEAFFNLESVVDPWIGSEYFKHLPGILTGFGIIGTFFGLIQGLIHFDPGLTDSADLKRGLGQLFGHVRDAFMFSGSAIAAAIAVTIVEKWLYSSCARWVGELSATLDGLFKVGVGEEYLASILKSSREATTQVRQLKESLVQELRHLLTELSDRQMRETRDLSADLGQTIRQSLRDPLSDIARTVALASSRETEAVKQVLEQLTASFIVQMRDTLGHQLADMSGLIQKAAQSVQHVEMAMHAALRDVQKSSETSAAGLQAATGQLTQRLLESQRTQGELVSQAVQGVLQKLSEAALRMTLAQEEMTRRVRDGNESTAARMRRQIESVSESQVATIGATRELLEKFTSLSGDVVESLAGASHCVVTSVNALEQAAERMSRVGHDLAELEGHVQKSSHDMVRASSHLASAAQNVGNSSRQLGEAAVRFEGVASSASIEANARRQLLLSLQDVIEQSQLASREFVQLAEQTRRALGSSVEQFESNAGQVLAGHVKNYQKQLGESLSSLRRALDQIAVRAGRDPH